MDKRLIAERFAKARGTYDREARVQQQVAERMMRLVLQHTGGDAFRFRNVVVAAPAATPPSSCTP